MNEYGIIESKLEAGCREGNRHNCIRDCARLAGGYMAAGRLDEGEAAGLRRLAMSLAGDSKEFQREWDRGVEFGQRQPAEADFAPDRDEPDRALDWDSPLALAGAGASQMAPPEWFAPEPVKPPEKINPEEQLRRYIAGLFQPEEHVGFVTDAMDRGGKWTPASKGVCYMTAGELLAALRKRGGFRNSIGDYNPEAGAWIRFNPLDGNGVSDANVTDHRYALVECDEEEIGKQVALIRSLNLPCKFLVHSGGHSVHAIVHIDAGADAAEYRRRVEFLYKTCREHGLKADKTGNPSRLSRMPGVMRGGNPQYIIDADIGAGSWREWIDYLEEQADDLPPLTTAKEQMARLADGSLRLAPELIGGVLREGHKMRLTGPSKAGKSFALLELAVCLSEGGTWLGRFPCQNPGNILYVNLELDAASCITRLQGIYEGLGIRPKHVENLHIWQLRGHAGPLDKLAPIMIRRCRDMHLKAIIIDPIYKVLTGDENAAADMAKFCNHFDKIAVECGCAVIDCHHHSKGSQAGKRSFDRGSGSGVFARDPDALLDMIELDAENARKQALRNREIAALADLIPRKTLAGMEPDAGPDAMIAAIERDAPERAEEARRARLAIRQGWEHATAWRIESTLREFPSRDGVNVWFRYPIHSTDEAELLEDCQPIDAEQPPWKQKRDDKPKKPDAGASVVNVLDEIFQDGDVSAISITKVAASVAEVCRGGSCSEKTVRNAVKKSGKYSIENNLIIKGRVQA